MLVDRESGVREDAAFFGPDRLRMFGCTSAPLARAIAGLVICCPYQAEFFRNYRREVMLARALAARGYAVQRFHYRGSGNSDGDPSDATFETMVEDALAAADRLTDRTGVGSVAFMGTRLGGMVAAAAAAKVPGAPIVLWEPTLDPGPYFRKVFRGRRVSELKHGDSAPRTSEEPIDELRRTGSVDILGYSIERSLYESTMGRTLLDEVGDDPRPVLLVQIGEGKGLRSDFGALVARWEARGFPVDAQVVPHAEVWWFGGGRKSVKEEPIRASALVETTVGWLERHLPPGGAGS